MSPSGAESQPRILLQGTLVVAIVHCLMESGVNKFDDLSGASAPAKFHRKTLIDSTPCTEQNSQCPLRTSESTELPRNLEDEMQGYLLQLPTSRLRVLTEADPEVRHTQRRKASAFARPT